MIGRTGTLRALDVIVAAGALLLLSPLLAVIALAVRATSRGPILFRQVRVGLGGKPFTLLKFRSMRAGTSGPRITPSADPRVTRVGGWLRRTKLDELPQLVNILRGEMSLIGPRPEVPEYLVRLGPAADAYAAVRPGLADAATLAFFDEASRLAVAHEPERYYVEAILPEKARLSVAYAAARTWRSDLRLVLALGRRMLAGAVLLALSAPAVHAAGPLLIVAPHPDDEVLAAGCRFDVVLCVNAGPPSAACTLAEPLTGLAVGGQGGADLEGLGATLDPRLPTDVRTCAGPTPVQVDLRGPHRRGTARLRLPVRVTMADGRRLRARATVVCHAAAPGAVHRRPRAL